VIWQYPCEDLIVTGRLYQVVGWFQNGYILRRKSSQGSKCRLLLKRRTPKRHQRCAWHVPGPISESFLLMVPMHVICERPRDTEVAETRLTILGNQDVVLDTMNISARFTQSLALPTGLMLPCEISALWRCSRPQHTCASYCRYIEYTFPSTFIDGHVRASDDPHPGSFGCTD